MRFYSALAIVLVVLFAHSAFAQRLAISVSVANIRSGPGTKYPILWSGEKNFPIVVLEKKGSWYRFKDFEGDQGWIHSSIVARDQTVITQKNRCIIRKGPGPKFDVLFIVEKGVPFEVIGTKGRWFNVRHADGDTGWIYSTLVW